MRARPKPLAGRKVVLVVAHHGYREEELAEPLALLTREGAEVQIASSSLGPASGMGGGRCDPQRLYSAVDVSSVDALVFVGGTGAAEYFDDRTAQRLVREAVTAGKLVGAMCFASSILANAGVLEGKPATGYPSREAHLRARGARYTGEPVAIAGRIVTGRGPEDAGAFAGALLAALS